jgi:hypothetical protein
MLGASVISAMPMSKLRLILPAFATGFLGFSAMGDPLTEAHVTKIVNRVQVVDPANGGHAASLHEAIKDEIELKTGVKSRSELLFQDNTLTRLGPETSFSFKAGTRDLSLGKGTMLLQVPKGQGGAKIRTAAVTAAITGTTILMDYTPGKHIKVLVLEGSLRLSANGPSGNSVVLGPGRMVLMRPDAKKIPPPVSVDLKKVMQTSSLVNMSKKEGGAPLPSAALIEKEIAQQAHDKATRDLVETDVVLHGSGTMALNSSGNVIDVLARTEQGRSLTVATTNASGSTGSVVPAVTPAPTPSAITSASPTPPAVASPTPATLASPTPATVASPTPATVASPTPVTGASPTPVAVASPTPASGVSPTPPPAPSPSATAPPNPSPTPGSSGDDDNDKNKGDHNGDGHGDSGKGNKNKGPGRPLRSVPPPIDRGRLSGREIFLAPTLSSRNGR